MKLGIGRAAALRLGLREPGNDTVMNVMYGQKLALTPPSTQGPQRICMSMHSFSDLSVADTSIILVRFPIGKSRIIGCSTYNVQMLIEWSQSPRHETIYGRPSHRDRPMIKVNVGTPLAHRTVSYT